MIPISPTLGVTDGMLRMETKLLRGRNRRLGVLSKNLKSILLFYSASVDINSGTSSHYDMSPTLYDKIFMSLIPLLLDERMIAYSHGISHRL